MVEGDDAGVHAVEHAAHVDLLRLPERVLGVRVHVHATRRVVVRLALVADLTQDVVERVGQHDLGAEAARRARPQERDRGRAERTEADAEELDDAAVEELAPGDAQRLGVERHPARRGCGRRGEHHGPFVLTLEHGGALDLATGETRGHRRLRLVWRVAVNSWFRWISGIDDRKGRVGRFPNRIEAEAMRLDRFVVEAVTPWETASGGQAEVIPGRDPRDLLPQGDQGALP